VTSLQDIQRAIDRLSPAERYTIAMWIRESTDPDDRVAEPAPAHHTTPEIRLLSVEDYLEFEMRATTRHEYVAGEIFAMSGASAAHQLIVGNVYSAFRNHCSDRHGGGRRNPVAGVVPTPGTGIRRDLLAAAAFPGEPLAPIAPTPTSNLPATTAV
jgi:hypothetical protein